MHKPLSIENDKLLTDICYSHKSSVIIQLFKKHERKITFFEQKLCREQGPVDLISQPEKRVLHRTCLELLQRNNITKGMVDTAHDGFPVTDTAGANDVLNVIKE